jgi:hypothetical protein
MQAHGFYQIPVSVENNLFENLSRTVELEALGKGRIGNHLLRLGEKGVPLVRTTTAYQQPAHNFAPIHLQLVEAINQSIAQHSENIPAQAFNNALIEIYEQSYTKMGYHSDQSLDLEPASYIGLFSCYEDPARLPQQGQRKLQIKDKATQAEWEIALAQNTCLLFSVATNSQFLHKIVLDSPQNPKLPDNKWLGLTFRTSKTFIRFKAGLPYFENGDVLTFANEQQMAAFYKLRGAENQASDFVYPKLTYTISPADLMLPVGYEDK